MENIVAVKIGGNVIDDENALTDFLSVFSKIPHQKILIHGGGKTATTISEQLNIPTRMIDGRRVTDQAALEVVTMVYGGLINKKIVAGLQANGCNAIGLTGADANIIEAHKRIHPTIDYGFVGDIDKVNPALLTELMERNFVPVIAPLTHDKKGNILNTNADTMAAQLAIALSKSQKLTFVYCFEKCGLLKNIDDPDSVISHVNLSEIQQLKEKQIITGGMIPKMENIVNALQNGVEKVILCHAKEVGSIMKVNSIFGTTFTAK
ncbi:MAG: acetylglutamate kinase [Sphingobacteriales bacterium]|nr:acetylglutamate kinase [Sphingobacteriales bacterium]